MVPARLQEPRRNQSQPLEQRPVGSLAVGRRAAGAAGWRGRAGAGIGGPTATRVARGDFNLVASVGYRREFYVATDRAEAGGPPQWQSGDVKHDSVQADFDIAFPVGANDSIELRIDHRFERNYTFDAIRGFSWDELLTGSRGGAWRCRGRTACRWW